MNFNSHSDLVGLHAFLGPSKYHWINYDDEKLVVTFSNFLATQRGTELHAFAAEAIRLGIKLPKTRQTLNLFVNDAIGYKMNIEQPLFYSPNCFGTADVISFKNNLLRIHDLKTGVTPVSMRQLEVYASLFCLEYGKDPNSIDMELRIYQNDEILVHEPSKEDILYIMEKIISFDKLINQINTEG